MRNRPKIGSEELRLLRFIADRGPTSVREASETFGVEAGVRLTTVQQMMERLRKKGLLERESKWGTYRYASTVTKEDLLEDIVREFVHDSLGGSLAPFALYLARSREIPEKELDELRRIVAELEGDAEEDKGE